ncbi:MAG: gliding motility-associated C-terminal domain-containing protein [Flavobacteriales bacterium]
MTKRRHELPKPSSSEGFFVISIPNVFTPNGDGINDVFKINAEGIESLRVYIYNSRGALVYEYDNMNGSWNGQINGKPSSSVTYYYLVKVAVAGDKHDYTGALMLFRD